MAVDVGSAVGYLDLDISGFLSGLKSAQQEAEKTTGNMATQIGGKISGIGSSLSKTGSTLTKNVTLPLAGIGIAGLKVATDFEKGMSEVKAISGATGKEFEALREQAIDLGASTAFSSGEVASAMTEMAKAGWSTQQILDGMAGVLDAAAASGENLATVSTIVADAITGFGMEAKDSTRVADLLTQAANSGTIGINDLGESFKYIAPVAGSMNMSIEDVTTAIAAMSMSGIKGSQAGTALRTMLTNLVNPSDACAAAMEELGISATNTDGSMKTLDEIVANLRTSFAGLTEAEKAQYAAIISGKTGMSGMLSLLNLTEEEYNKIAESMDNCGGVAQETAAIMQDNLQSKIEQLGGSLESLAIKMADHVIPYLQKFVEWLTGLVDKFTNLDPATQKTILAIAGVAAAIGPCLMMIGKLITGVGNTVTAFGKIPGAVTKVKGGFKALSTGLLNMKEGFALSKAGFSGLATQAGGVGAKLGSMAASFGPWGIAIAAIIAVVIGAFTSLWKNNEEFRNKIMAIWNQIKETFQGFTQGIVDRLNSLGFEFENITDVIKAIWDAFCNFLAPLFTGVFQSIADTFKFITDSILNTFDFWVAIFKGDWEGAWNAVKAQFSNIWEFIKNIFKTTLDTMKGVLDVVLGWFGSSWDACWNGIKDFFSNVWNGIKDFFVGIWDAIVGTLKSGIDFIVNLIKFAFDLITIPFRFIWENCKETIISIWDAIKEKISTVINAIKSTIETIFNAIKTFFSTIWNGIKDTVISVWNSIKDTATTVWEGIKTAISKPINAAKETISNVVNAIKEKFTSGFNSAKNTVTGVFDSIKSKIQSVMDGAKNIVTGAVDKLKKAFNFSWSLPKLKLPHIKVSGGQAPYGIAGKGSLPKFSIEWYRKAMNGGMILNSATIFGIDPISGKLLGGGEAGSEVVVGTNSLLQMIRQSVAGAIRPIVEVMHELSRASAELGYITFDGFTKVKEKFGKGENPTRDKSVGGDTYIFHTSKPIDEIEAAKQMKKTKRELAEGF